MGGPILWELGYQGLSGYFLLNWDGEGHWASPSCWSQASESLQWCWKELNMTEWLNWLTKLILGWVIFSMVRCRYRYIYIYPCWTGTACCSLLTWAEAKQVRQSVIHGAIISSINMLITGISRGISQLQIPPHQENDPPKRDFSHPENSPACSLRSYRIWMFFLRTVRLSLT